MTRRTLSSLLVVAACALALGPYVRGQDPAPPAAPKAQRWDYRSEAWAPEDTLFCLRLATGDDTSGMSPLLERLANTTIPAQHPDYLRAVNVRIGEKLAAAGAEGWELILIREGTTVEADRYALPAPNLFFKRRALP